MKEMRRISLAALSILFILLSLQVSAQEAVGESIQPKEVPQLTGEQVSKIETFVKKQMEKGKIPGLSLVIVNRDQLLYQKDFGFANVDRKEPVTQQTMFELGSTSKAFTALGILCLEAEGKLQLSDPVTKYLPWLRLKYQGKDVEIKISHLLYHTGGIPHYETLDDIVPSEEDNALEAAVRTLVGSTTRHEPGAKFGYSSMGYNVLGLIIQEVSGQSFEEYIKKNVLEALGLKNSVLSRKDAKGMAQGYKIGFQEPREYDAPMYRGNTPGGYIITNVEDLTRWLKIQMGTAEPAGISKELIEKSHIVNPDLPGTNYAAGWIVFKNLGIISHSGSNPNFSSFIGFSNEKVGVAVLANSNSMFTSGIGRGIGAILRGMEPEPYNYDMNMQFDELSSKITYVVTPFFLVALLLLLRSVLVIIGKKRRFSTGSIMKWVGAGLATLFVVGLGYVLTIVPSLLGFNVSLSFGFVWMPVSFTCAFAGIFFTFVLFYLFFLSKLFFPAEKAAAAK